MSRVLGIHLQHTCLSAVLMRDGRPATTWEEAYDGDDVGAALDRLFSALPQARWRPLVVRAALGASLATTKCIRGLPSLGNDRELSALIRESAQRFFVGDPETRVFAAHGDGELVVAESIDATTVRGLAAAAQRARVSRVVALSSAATVAAADNGSVHHVDDGVLQVIECHDGGIQAISRRRWDGQGQPWSPRRTGMSALLALEPSLRVAAAAALVDVRSSPTFLVVGPSSHSTPRWRARLAMACLASAGLLLAAAPVVAARADATRSAARLRLLSADYAAALEARRRIIRAEDALNDIAVFQQIPATGTRVIATVNRALPDDAALIAFSMDSSSGSVVAVAERIVAVVGALEDADGIASAELTGPITRERLGEREMERATIRFRWSANR